MRMLRDFKALTFQLRKMQITCTMFQVTTNACNYRIYNVIAIFIYILNPNTVTSSV